jgi:hypothetical protein
MKGGARICSFFARKTTADERQQPEGELSAEALAILAELSENEIATGMIETLDPAQLPEGLTGEWTE